MSHPLGKNASRSRISSRYGERINPVNHKPQFHNGVDFAIESGTPVCAPWDAVVLNQASDELNGNYLRLRHGTDIVTVYCHLDSFEPGVDRDAIVSKGQVIGYVGTTGRSTGPHLHFGVMLCGKWVDPLPVLALDNLQEVVDGAV